MGRARVTAREGRAHPNPQLQKFARPTSDFLERRGSFVVAGIRGQWGHREDALEALEGDHLNARRRLHCSGLRPGKSTRTHLRLAVGETKTLDESSHSSPGNDGLNRDNGGEQDT